MGINDFDAMFYRKMLNDIKNIVQAKVDLSLKDCCDDQSELLIKKVDKKMTRILRDAVFMGDIDFGPKFKHRYWLFTDGNNLEEVRNSLKCMLALYYVALFYDNVELLERFFIEEEVPLGKNSSELLLCALTADMSSLFGEDEYVRILKKSGHVFNSFYQSISEVEGKERKDYLKKFARILKKKDMEGVFSNILDKKVLDTYDDETYYAASTSQMNCVMCAVQDIEKEETRERVNNLLQNTDFCNAFGQSFDKMFDYFTDEDLLSISESDIAYYREVVESYPEYIDRIKKLLAEKPKLKECEFKLRPALLDVLNDEEVLNLNDKMLKNLGEYAKLDCFYSEKDVAEIARAMADKNNKRKKLRQVKQYLLPKKND